MSLAARQVDWTTSQQAAGLVGLILGILGLSLLLGPLIAALRRTREHKDTRHEVTLDAKTLLPPGAIRDHRGKHDLHPQAFFDDGSNR